MQVSSLSAVFLAGLGFYVAWVKLDDSGNWLILEWLCTFPIGTREKKQFNCNISQVSGFFVNFRWKEIFLDEHNWFFCSGSERVEAIVLPDESAAGVCRVRKKLYRFKFLAAGRPKERITKQWLQLAGNTEEVPGTKCRLPNTYTQTEKHFYGFSRCCLTY